MRPSRKNSADSLSLGNLVGHYVIQQRIGAGGGGVVYRAFDHRLQRAVAVKIVDPSLLGEERTWALAVSEARAAGSLSHPNICAVFDVVEEDERVCLAMELVEGRSFHSAIPGHGMPVDDVLRYGAQVASALAHAHDKGICHGDVSARNVMLTLDGSVKVLDFGLAHALGRNRSPVEPDEGVRRDLQQLGILLCQMATGVFPPRALVVLAGNAPTSSILESPPVAVLPDGLRTVIARCLEKDPSRCYQRAQQTVADLEVELHRVRARAAGFPRTATGRRALLATAVLLLAALLVSIPLWHLNSRLESPHNTSVKTLQPAHQPPSSTSGAAAKAVAHHAAEPVQEAAPPAGAASKPEAATRPVVHHAASPVHEAPAKRPLAPKTGTVGLPSARVWMNTRTKIYHCAASRFYGKTLQGKFMTQAQALAAGDRPADGKACR